MNRETGGIALAKQTQSDWTVQKPPAPIYLLFGTQDYLIRYMQKNIIHEALPDDTRDFNLSHYDMLESPIEMAIEDAETIPFFGEKKVVIMENPFFLTGERVKAKVEQHPERLERYAEHPSPETVLIITAHYKKLDRRKKLVKSLEKKADVRELTKLSDAQIYKLMENVAAQFGADYTKSGHEQLIASVGSDLMQLSSEVKKCALYCGGERPIDDRSVLEIGSRSLETNVFLLVDKVMQKKTAEAIHLLHELVGMKEEPLKLLALLERQFRIVCQVSDYQSVGYTQRHIAGKLGLHPYVVKLAAKQTGLYSRGVLKQALVKCSDTDYQIKTGRIDKKLALEMLIHEIAGGLAEQRG
ncbi:DNA polymerase III subunit delta [Sporolactobacillus sp. THM7-7]|nr:DNA polymerase III subunit delta [Sporolactobacillus sp. THM7-7]